MAPTNVGNEISPEAVEALLQACDDSVGLVRRYYELKRRLMGLSRLAAFDRYAPVGLEKTSTILLEEAQELVVATFAEFSAAMGAVARRAFEDGWVDSPVAQGKCGGAFAYPVPFIHPFILLNWAGSLEGALTLAHELGHGVHQSMSATLPLLVGDVPITLAETASVFGEKLVFAKLMERAGREERLALLCSSIEEIIATSFRQAAITRFEQKLYEARAQGELSVEAVNAMWLSTQKAALGGGIDLGGSYSWWWVYVHHLLRPFYCYGYVFGQVLVLALYARYLEEGKSFAPKYLQLLAAGGSDSPANLLAKLGIDIESPDFWQGGFNGLKGMIEEAEALAAELGC